MSKHEKNDAATRCYAASEQWSDGQIVLSGEESHHLHRVLRKAVGDPVAVLDGAGREAKGRLVSVSKQEAVVAVDEIIESARPCPQLVLVQSMIRNARMEFVIQKAVELGAAEIVPLVTDHCVVKIKQGKREDRLETIAISALKQSGNLWRPKIYRPVSLEEGLNLLRGVAGFYGALVEGAEPFRTCLRGCDAARLAVVVGPEGDFSRREYDLLQDSDFVPVSLGDTVLRAETAAMFMMAAVRYEFGGSRGGGT